MKNPKPSTPFAPYEMRNFVMPLTLASILLLVGIIIDTSIYFPEPNPYTIAYGALATLYIFVSNILTVRFIAVRKMYVALNAIISGVGLGFLSIILPEHLHEARHILIIFCGIAIATMTGKSHAYIFMACTFAISLPGAIPSLTNIEEIFEYFTPIVVSVVVIETIVRIKNTTQQHIGRLETINKVSRQINQSLDTKQTLSLLDATIRETLAADTYFIGIVKGDEIYFELFHDDGEYFNDIHAPLAGTLSGWIVKNQKELFLPDLREDVQLEGVQLYVIGKEKTNLSWIGVPLKAENVTGVLALASYTANAFDRADIELLASLGQHVTLALDNTIRHAQVEKQARLDSLTGVYNHGYFLKTLAEQAEEATRSQKPLSLIMLDIDFFKQYNDTYGHLVGDRILNALCSAIQHNIKQSDTVGRWGGEEFVISLPGANGGQALQIAKRVSETMRRLRVADRDQNTVPIPTVSQGIAVYPHDADEIYRLIDIADKRLYVAKERGRNQIEPAGETTKMDR